MSQNKPVRQPGASPDHARAKVENRHTSASFFVGPLPPAEEFAHYNDGCEGAGSRILAMAERQADHRQLEEQRESAREHGRILLGQVLGFVLIGGTIASGVWLFSTGKVIPGGVTVGGGLLTAIVAYLRAYAPRGADFGDKESK